MKFILYSYKLELNVFNLLGILFSELEIMFLYFRDLVTMFPPFLVYLQCHIFDMLLELKNLIFELLFFFF